MAKEHGDLLQGTLALVILKALAGGEEHGFGIARWIERTSDDVLIIEEGSLYPALRRLEDRGWISSRWGLSDNNRRARYYSLTRTGRQHLRGEAASWLMFARAVTSVLRAEPALA